MKIIQDIKQNIYYRTCNIRLRFLSRKFMYISLDSNYLLSRDILIGSDWGAPSAIWKPLGFNRSTLYG